MNWVFSSVSLSLLISCYFMFQVPLPFSTFIGLCKQRMANAEGHEPAPSDAQEQDPLLSGDAPKQIYLAQVWPR